METMKAIHNEALDEQIQTQDSIAAKLSTEAVQRAEQDELQKLKKDELQKLKKLEKALSESE